MMAIQHLVLTTSTAVTVDTRTVLGILVVVKIWIMDVYAKKDGLIMTNTHCVNTVSGEYIFLLII